VSDLDDIVQAAADDDGIASVAIFVVDPDTHDLRVAETAATRVSPVNQQEETSWTSTAS
jgi:hypothetical protein